MASHYISNTSCRLQAGLIVLPSFSEFLSENGIASDFSDHSGYHSKWPHSDSPRPFTNEPLSSSSRQCHTPLHPELMPIFRISSRDPIGGQSRSVSQIPFGDKAAVLKLSSLLQHVDADHPPEHRDMSLTKAGKPRKRSERACTRCRELKVKCEPSDPMCSHCWRRGYVCDLVTR